MLRSHDQLSHAYSSLQPKGEPEPVSPQYMKWIGHPRARTLHPIRLRSMDVTV